MTAAVLAVSAAGVMAPSTSFAANSSGESVIAIDPLPGYTVDEDGPFNGAIDEGTMMVLGGLDPADVPDQAHNNMKGQARTWVSDTGDHAVIVVLDCGDVPTASNVLTAGVGGASKASDSTFDPGFAGSAGFTSKPQSASTTLYTVIWRQGTYYVVTFVIAAYGGMPDVKALAASEAAFLRSSTGAVPAVGVSGSSAADEPSIAYQAGQLTGTLLVVGAVIFLIFNGKRRRDERQAYKARMATPPPVFPMHPPTGVPADDSAWARLPPPPPPPPPA